jgi:hypothetical protein
MNFINIAGMDDALVQVQNIYSMVSGTMAGAIILLVLGLVFCFLGFRLARFVSAIVGAIIGGGLCAFVASSYLPAAAASVGTIAAGVIGALLVAYLFYHISYAVVFVVCAAAGAALGSVPALAFASGSSVAYVVIAVCAVLFGVAGVLFFKPVMIFLTGLGGLLAAPQIFTLAQVTTSIKLELAAGIALSVVGMVIQALTTRGRTKPGLRKKKSEDGEASENGESAEAGEDGTKPLSAVEYEEIDETPEPPHMAADSLNEVMRSKGFVRFLMAISPVLMLLAAVAVIAFQSAHIEIVLVFAFLTYAARRYKLLTITFLAMFAYTLYDCFLALANQNMPELALSAISCFLFFILTLIALRMNQKAHPKKRIRRVPVQQEATETAEQLEETRPLSVSEAADAMQEEAADGEATELMGTHSLEADSDTKTFAADVPEEFRQTQEEIFGKDSLEEDDMAAEPDDVVAPDTESEKTDETLGDTRVL